MIAGSNKDQPPPAKMVAGPGVIPVADSLLDAFSRAKAIRTIRKNDRDNLEALCTLIVSKLQGIPVEREG